MMLKKVQERGKGASMSPLNRTTRIQDNKENQLFKLQLSFKQLQCLKPQESRPSQKCLVLTRKLEASKKPNSKPISQNHSMRAQQYESQSKMLRDLELENESLQSTLELYQNQNNKLCRQNEDCRSNADQLRTALTAAQNALKQKDKVIESLRDKDVEYEDFVRKLQEVEEMQEGLIEEKEEAKMSCRICESLLANIATIARMNSSPETIVTQIKFLTQTHASHS